MHQAFGFLYAICATMSALLFAGQMFSAGMNGSRNAGCELLLGSVAFAIAAFAFLKISEFAA